MFVSLNSYAPSSRPVIVTTALLQGVKMEISMSDGRKQEGNITENRKHSHQPTESS